MFISIRDIFFLAALVIGCLLIFLARRQENWPRITGLIVGFTVITVSCGNILLKLKVYSGADFRSISPRSYTEIINNFFAFTGDMLFAVAFFMGYLLLFLARREESWRRLFGHIVSISIMLVSAVYILLNPLMYFKTRHSIEPQTDKETVQKRMKLSGGIQPWFPEEIPQTP